MTSEVAETVTVPAVTAEADNGQPMDVDGAEDSRKRKADVAVDAVDTNDNKRQKVEAEKDAAPVRDREYASVLVSGLSADTTEADIQRFFRECGQIREVTLTRQGEQMVAAVEFMDRESVPAALTRDKKKIGEQEVHVYQAGHSTLFVTNFPEKMDDEGLRQLFAPYGDIVETRWPSRKFKDSRRFCYVQFTTTGAAATASQELNGKELESGFPISVLISDPERKKERSDAHADARELYVNQLSKFMNDQDMERVFSPVCIVVYICFHLQLSDLLRLVVWHNQEDKLDKGRRWQMQGLWLCRIRNRGECFPCHAFLPVPSAQQGMCLGSSTCRTVFGWSRIQEEKDGCAVIREETQESRAVSLILLLLGLW